MQHVFVNGRRVVADGAITAERPGRPLRGPGSRRASVVSRSQSRQSSADASRCSSARLARSICLRATATPSCSAACFSRTPGLPVPGETVLLAGAALAHFGQLSLGWVIVDRDRRPRRSATTSGSSSAGSGGRRIAERHGWRVGLTPARLAEFDRFFERHGPKTVFVARFITGLRVSVVADAVRNMLPNL